MVRPSSLIFLAFASVAQFAESATTIMPFGDSLTRGYHGEELHRTSYREELEKLFLALSVDFDFVGGEEFARDDLVDGDVQAVAGYAVESMTTEFEDEVELYLPDIVLLLAGTNDHHETDPNTFFDKYLALTKMIRRASADSQIVVSTIPPFGCCPSGKDQAYVDLRNVDRFPIMNQAIKDIADADNRIEWIDLNAVVDVTQDLVGDRIHLSVSGQKKLADLFLRRISSLDYELFDGNNIDALATRIRSGANDSMFDFDNSGDVNFSDHEFFVTQYMHTWIGDSNLDGQFNTQDLIAVFTANQYEDAAILNSSWSTGDWNGDGEFTSRDLVLAFVESGYESGRRGNAILAPEPTSINLLVILFSTWGIWKLRLANIARFA